MARRKVKGTDHAIYSFSLPAFLGLVALLLLTILHCWVLKHFFFKQ